MVNASLFSNPALISYSDSLLEKRLNDPPWDMDTRAERETKCMSYLGVPSSAARKTFSKKKTTGVYHIFLYIQVH